MYYHFRFSCKLEAASSKCDLQTLLFFWVYPCIRIDRFILLADNNHTSVIFFGLPQDGLTPLDLCLYSGRDTRTFEMIKLLKQFPKSQ